MGNFLSKVGFGFGCLFILFGGFLWVQNGFPTTALIPYKNTFGANPIHLVYLGVFILFGFAIHGFLKHGWFKQNK